MTPEEVFTAVRDRYRTVAACPTGQFPYPVGRESALGLGYRREWLEAVPAEIVAHFVGVGNPFAIHLPGKGDRVLDVGTGSGLDAFIAASLVGPDGRVVGIDLSPEMLSHARAVLDSHPSPPLALAEGDAASLPFPDASFDLAISNGVLNLMRDKDIVFRELARVLRPGGTLAVADLLVLETVPDELLASKAAWSS